jgi:hypothetical protein
VLSAVWSAQDGRPPRDRTLDDAGLLMTRLS